MPKNFKKIIFFDFDGVIADTFSFCYNAWNSLIPLTVDEYRAWFEGNINKVFQQINQEKLDRFFSEYASNIKTLKANKGVVEAIKKLSENYILIIISSTITPLISDYLEVFGIKTCFSEILGDDIEKSKTKKIQMILDKYSVGPSETIFITDTLGDVNEAEKCGVKSIAVTWGYHPIETLKKGNPYKIINSQDEIMPSINEYFQTHAQKVENLDV